MKNIIWVTSLKPKCLISGFFLNTVSGCVLCSSGLTCMLTFQTLWLCAFSGVCPCVWPPWSQPVAAGGTFFSQHPSNRCVVFAVKTHADLELHHHEKPRSDRTANDSGDAAPEVAGRSTEFYKEVGMQEPTNMLCYVSTTLAPPPTPLGSFCSLISAAILYFIYICGLITDWLDHIGQHVWNCAFIFVFFIFVYPHEETCQYVLVSWCDCFWSSEVWGT